MSTESPNIIQTATVGILSPSFREVLMTVNVKLGMILPPGGKFEEKDKDTIGTALRETEEEIGSHLFGATGYFIDENGQPLDYPTAVNTESFIFPDGNPGIDDFFLFQHIQGPGIQLKGDSEAFWMNRAFLSMKKINLGGVGYTIGAPNLTSILLRLMK